MNEQLRKEYLSRIINGDESLVIPIYDDKGFDIGVLRPITTMHLQSNDIIEKMTNWRNQYKTFFLTQFNATSERTKQWLSKVVLSDTSRMLFLIYSDDTLIGHYGFKNLHEYGVEVDNLLRGERHGHPLLMRSSVSALADWLFDVMGIDEIYAYIFADNAMALKLHKDLGFSFEEKIPLQMQVDGDEIVWIAGLAGELSPDNHYYQKVVLTRNAMMG